MKKYILFAIGLFSLTAVGQEKLEIIDLNEINNSISLKSQENDYEGVLEILEKVNKNDTSYPNSLLRKSYYLMALERYDEAISTIDEGLSMKIGDLKSSFYQNKGVAFTRQNKFDKAIETYDQGLELFPASHVLLYNKSIALQEKGQLKEAVKALEQVITLNPFYANAYIKLGSIYYTQERPSQALLAFNLALLVDPDSEYSFARLKTANSMFNTKNENKRTPGLILSEDDKAFDEIDLIISNRIALNNNYKIDNELDYDLTKQNHALLLKLANYKGKGGFWSKKVVPLFQWIQESNNFDVFSYTISYSIENEKYKKIVTKKTKEITEFLKLAIPRWTTLARTDNKDLFSNKTVQFEYDGSTLSISGMGTMKGEKQVGDWFYFNKEGRIVAEAHYDKNGERSGTWKWYNDQLKLKEVAVFKNGKLEGENTIIYPNGQLSLKGFYKNGELDGKFLYYNENGALMQKKYFENGKLTGTYTSYFSVGEEIPEFIIPYKDDKVQEKASEYYANGKLYSEIPFTDGNRHGLQKTHFLNGNVSSELVYVNGKLQGDYKIYFLNGEISEKGTYINDLLQGPYTTYYADGTLQSEGNYDDGVLNGAYTYYDYDGKKHYSYTYKKGDIIEYKFFNKKGEILKEGKRRGGEFYYNGFAANGNLTSEGLYNVSGGRKGEWKYYGDNGNLISKATLEDDLIQGAYTSYYPNGAIEWSSNYKNDTLVGYYANYHKNGKIENQGGYKDGLQQGEWRFYYIDGSLKSINYYHKGDFNGTQEYYGVDGKLTNKAVYDRDNLLKDTFYDRNGNQFQVVDYKPSKKDTTLIFKHYNGKIYTKTSYLHGVKHGTYKSYFFDGKIDTEGAYLNGVQNGTWTWYFENGQPNVKATYVLGNLDGEYVRYYENGQIEDSFFYKLDDRVGTWKSYYEDGTPYTISSYLFGKQHGRKEFYSPSGKLQLIRFYNHGTLIGYSYNDTNGKEVTMIPITNETGKVIAYYDNGKVSRELEYKNGQQIGTYKTYYYNGQLKDEFVNVNDEYEGPKIEYYANGNIKEKRNYLTGELDGKVTRYYENGKLKEEAHFKNGVQVGNASKYDDTGKKIKSEDYFNGYMYAQQKF